MRYDPTGAVEQIRQIRQDIEDEIDRYSADPSLDMDPEACGDHYDALSQMYEDITDLTLSLDYYLSTGGELPSQWKTGV